MNFENKVIVVIVAVALAIMVFQAVKINVHAQSNEPPLRYLPKLNEDEVIICAADYKHERYYGQVSCIISDDGLDNKVLKKLGDKATSLKNTFEMGLID